MIKNIIFDIGNVILTFNLDYLVSSFYKGDDYELLKEKLFKDWERLDEDAISLEEYENKVKASLPDHLHGYASAVLNHWEYYVSYCKGISELIYELKRKGYKLYILSNMTRHFIKIAHRFPVLTEFDGIVYSAPIKFIKPQSEIYNYILNKYNLNPTECLFIDDKKENLDSASRFGIKTFHYEFNTEKLKKFILTL